MSSDNHTTSSPLSLLAAPFQIVCAFIISLLLIFGVGYGSAWITDQSCPLCSSTESEGSQTAKPEENQEDPAPQEEESSEE